MTPEPRLFVAAPIAEPARARIAETVEAIRATEPPGRGVRWVRLDGLHVTLRFLGPAPESRIGGIVAAMRRAADGVEPFRIRIHDAGAFPATGRPRTIWLAIDEGHAQLADLAARLGQGLVDAGWPLDERPFRAHLTLARADGVRSGRETASTLKAKAADMTLESPIDRLVLFESITGGGPARYVEREVVAIG